MNGLLAEMRQSLDELQVPQGLPAASGWHMLAFSRPSTPALSPLHAPCPL